MASDSIIRTIAWGAVRLTIVSALFCIALYGYVWLVDGCPDIQRIGNLSRSSQELILAGYLCGATVVLLATGWFLFRPRKRRLL